MKKREDIRLRSREVLVVYCQHLSTVEHFFLLILFPLILPPTPHSSLSVHCMQWDYVMTSACKGILVLKSRYSTIYTSIETTGGEEKTERCFEALSVVCFLCLSSLSLTVSSDSNSQNTDRFEWNRKHRTSSRDGRCSARAMKIELNVTIELYYQHQAVVAPFQRSVGKQNKTVDTFGGRNAFALIALSYFVDDDNHI